MSVKDANSNLAMMGCDGFDQQDRLTFPSKTQVGQDDANDYEEYGYDASGNRTSLRKRDGRTHTVTYDALNRMMKDVPASRTVYYGYDLWGLQTHARFDSASGEGVGTAYDGFGQASTGTTAMGGSTRTVWPRRS